MKKQIVRISKPVFDKDGYQVNMTDLNGEPLPDAAEPMTRAELDAIGFPRPEEFAQMFKTERINLQLSQRTVNYFKTVAKQEKVSYQPLIRMVLDHYVTQAEAQH